MSVGFSCRFPILNEIPVLHVIQNVADEFALITHRSRKLSANPFNRSTEQIAIVEFILV